MRIPADSVTIRVGLGDLQTEDLPMGRSNRAMRNRMESAAARDPVDGQEITSVVSEVDELRKENAQLRELVIQLSKIAIKNIVEQK
jgi:hypothetical protein